MPPPIHLTADRSSAPLQHRQQARRYLQHRYRQLFGVGPYARWQNATRGGSQWVAVYSNRELALVLDLLQVEVSRHG